MLCGCAYTRAEITNQGVNRDNELIDMNVIKIHEGELTAWNPLTEELTIDFNCKASDAVIGYAGYFELLNGIKKSVYWSIEQMKKYRKKLSQLDSGWNKYFDALVKKTAISDMFYK